VVRSLSITEIRYSLYGFIIIERENYLGWIQHVGDFNDTGDMMYLTGRAYIHEAHDVLLLGKSKTLEKDNVHRSFDDVEAYMGTLPKWEKTKYYVKLADLKLDSLLECETGNAVYSDFNRSILKSLVTGESD
jgi:hypothetical protein